MVGCGCVGGRLWVVVVVLVVVVVVVSWRLVCWSRPFCGLDSTLYWLPAIFKFLCAELCGKDMAGKKIRHGRREKDMAGKKI